MIRFFNCCWRKRKHFHLKVNLSNKANISFGTKNSNPRVPRLNLRLNKTFNLFLSHQNENDIVLCSPQHILMTDCWPNSGLYIHGPDMLLCLCYTGFLFPKVQLISNLSYLFPYCTPTVIVRLGKCLILISFSPLERLRLLTDILQKCKTPQTSKAMRATAAAYLHKDKRCQT